ncbi:MAG: hypothetical protein JWO47_282 [Candidatus Saccharibacteria bacterium]|nr:hypothetical protein [Candidatus Saccharibacteria bacterium]
MGLIRKSLAIGTLGVVHGSSKKQRMAKKNLEATKKLTEEMSRNNDIAAAQLKTEQFQATTAQRQLVSSQQLKEPVPVTSDIYSELEKLSDLKNKGIINQQDFDAKKKQLLGL